MGLTPIQTELFTKVLVLLAVMMGSGGVSAYLFREVRSIGFLIASFVVTIVTIFIAIALASTENALLALSGAAIFGAAVGSTLGSFTLLVGEAYGADQKTLAAAVGWTLGIIGLATFAAAMIGLFAGIDLSGLGVVLFTGLFVLIGLSLLGLVHSFGKWGEFAIGIGASIFWMVYLLYDFNRIVTKYGETANWSAAMDVSMHIYLDMVNLFVRLLPIILEVMNKSK